MDNILSKSINQLKKTPEYSQKLYSYLSIDKIKSLTGPISNIKLKTLKKIPVPFVRETIDMLVDFISSDIEPIKVDDERSIRLWKNPPCRSIFEKTPYIIPFLLKKKAAVIIIAPGGGYSSVSLDHEGIQVAKALNEQGFHAIVLNYRVSPSRYPAPQLDLIRAIQITRSMAEEWKIIPEQLALMGFSAGGHLCSSTAALYKELAWQSGKLKNIDAKPNALVLGYPQIDLCFKVMNTPSGVFLLNSKTDMCEYRRLSSHNLVSPNYPPTFLWSEADDPFVKVSENSEPFKKALETAKIPHEYWLYEGDEHGSGLAIGRPAESWLSAALDFLTIKQGFQPAKNTEQISLRELAAAGR